MLSPLKQPTLSRLKGLIEPTSIYCNFSDSILSLCPCWLTGRKSVFSLPEISTMSKNKLLVSPNRCLHELTVHFKLPCGCKWLINFNYQMRLKWPIILIQYPVTALLQVLKHLCIHSVKRQNDLLESKIDSCLILIFNQMCLLICEATATIIIFV